MTAEEGEVVKAPASLTSLLQVVVPSFDNEQGDKLRWMPRVNPAHEDTGDGGSPAVFLMPKKGDQCLVITTETGHSWVAAWWPVP
jgi:myo-inositol-hexaphosphate 3-phosphohydrolase